MVLPRRSYPPLLGRLTHDRTADRIARVTSRITGCAATIVPFDTTARVHDPAEYAQREHPPPGSQSRSGEPADDHDETGNEDLTRIAAINERGCRVVTGRVHAIRIRLVGQSSILACTITDDSGELTALFYGRTHNLASSPAPGSGCEAR